MKTLAVVVVCILAIGWLGVAVGSLLRRAFTPPDDGSGLRIEKLE